VCSDRTRSNGLPVFTGTLDFPHKYVGEHFGVGDRALKQAALRVCEVSFFGDPIWMPTCVTSCRELALAGDLDSIIQSVEVPFNTFNSVIL